MTKAKLFVAVAVAGSLFAATAPASTVTPSFQGKVTSAKAYYGESLAEQVRHQLVTLPFYSVFDNLEYKVNGSEVTLLGQVTQPVVKIDAENAVARIEGVTRVINKIEVLHVSPMDDQIRRAEFHAIYSDPTLERYAYGSVPPIHIIVEDGHVTLEGVVANQTDKDLVNIRANGVPGVFSVTNNLQVQSGE